MSTRPRIRNFSSRRSRSASKAAGRRKARPGLEALERRAVPAVFTVNTLADTIDGNVNTLSLREAVQLANNRPGADDIVFAGNLEGALILTSGRIRITSPVSITAPDLNEITVVGLNGKALGIDPRAGTVVIDDQLTIMDGPRTPASTPPRPRLLGVAPIDATTLVLDFNTRLGKNASLASSYSIDGLTIQRVIATKYPSRVVLVTSPQGDLPYAVKLNNLVARDGRKVQVLNGAGSLTGIDAGIDREPPRVVGAVSLGNDNVLVSFSEAMADSALDPAHYSIAQGTDVREAGALAVRGGSADVAPVFSDDSRTAVILTTSPQNELGYALKVVNVTDLAGNAFAPPVLALGGQSITYNRAEFRGTPPRRDQLVDSDGDGLTDNEEQRGWLVVYRTADGRTVDRWVTSDPSVVDTDGDGFPDNVEAQLKLDPRDADTDDDLLTDWQEYTEVFSDSLNADSDGDGVDDGTEFLYVRSSPIFADTDGDQIPDGIEISLGGFYNPLVANLPVPKIEVGNVSLSLRVDVVATSSRGTRKLDSKTAESTLATTDNQSYTSTSESTQNAYAKAGLTNKINTGGNGSVFPENEVTQSVEAGWSGTWRSEYSVSSSRETQRALSNARTTEKEVQVGEDVQTQVSDARIQTAISLSNASPIAYRLRNLQVTALMVDPRNPTTLVPVATLVPEFEPEGGFAMGPLVPARGPIIVASQNVFPSRVEALMANPQSLVFKISNFDILDESGRNFAFASQDVVERTGRLEIDYGGLDANGDGKDDGTEILFVSTAAGRPIADTNGDGIIDVSDRRVTFDPAGKRVGLTVRDALADAGLAHYTVQLDAAGDLVLDPDYDPALRIPVYLNDAGEPVKLSRAQIRSSYATMIVQAARPDGSLYPLERIYRIRERANDDFSSSTWEVLTPTGIAPDRGLNDVIYSGESFTLAFVQDRDGDLLPASLEAFYGSSDTSKDTDDDGLDDRFEALIGWDVNIPGRGIIHVNSSPRLADTDGDGLSDRSEAPGRWLDANGNGLMDAGELLRSNAFWVADILSLKRLDIAVDSDGNGTYEPEGSQLLAAILGASAENPLGSRIIKVGGVGFPFPDSPLETQLRGLYYVDENSDGVIDGLSNDIYHPYANPPFIDYITDPTDPDSDRDRLSDFSEVDGFTYRPIDSSTDLVARTNPELADTDGDTVSDGLERRFGLDPADGLDRDTDADGLPDRVETTGWDVTIERVSMVPLEVAPGKKLTFSKVKSDPSMADTDGDGLTDFEEYFLRTLPADARIPPFVRGIVGNTFSVIARGIDSDGDGITDFDEVRGFRLVGEGRDDALVKLSPLDADADNDGLSDGEEAGLGLDLSGNRVELGYGYRWVVASQGEEPRRVFTDPRDPDADNDRLPDGAEKYRTQVQVVDGAKSISYSQSPYTIRPVRWDLGYGAPTSGRNMIVLGLDTYLDDQDRYYDRFFIRIFDAKGDHVGDWSEDQLNDVTIPLMGSAKNTLRDLIKDLVEATPEESKKLVQTYYDVLVNLTGLMVGELPDARSFLGADPEKANTDGDRRTDYEESLLGTDPTLAGYKITIQFDYLQFGSGDADDGDIGNGPPGEVESSLLGGADVDLNAYIRRYDPNSTRLFNLGELEKFFDPGGDITIWSQATHVKQGSVEKFSGTTPRSTTFELGDGQAFSLGVLLKEVDNIDTSSTDYVQVVLGDYSDGGVDVKVEDGAKRSAIFTASDIKALLDSKNSQVGIFSLVFEFAKSDNTDPDGDKGNNDKMTGKLAFKVVVE